MLRNACVTIQFRLIRAVDAKLSRLCAGKRAHGKARPHTELGLRFQHADEPIS